MSTRYLCSHLVRLFADGKEQWVNLEEIWDTGAVLECEEAVTSGGLAMISTREVSFAGQVVSVEDGLLGWRVEMLFSADSQWSVERWMPDHTIDVSKLKLKRDDTKQ